MLLPCLKAGMGAAGSTWHQAERCLRGGGPAANSAAAQLRVQAAALQEGVRRLGQVAGVQPRLGLRHAPHVVARVCGSHRLQGASRHAQV